MVLGVVYDMLLHGGIYIEIQERKVKNNDEQKARKLIDPPTNKETLKCGETELVPRNQ